MDLRGWREASSVRRCVVSIWPCPGSVQEALQVLLGWSPHRGNPWAALGTPGRVLISVYCQNMSGVFSGRSPCVLSLWRKAAGREGWLCNSSRAESWILLDVTAVHVCLTLHVPCS